MHQYFNDSCHQGPNVSFWQIMWATVFLWILSSSWTFHPPPDSWETTYFCIHNFRKRTWKGLAKYRSGDQSNIVSAICISEASLGIPSHGFQVSSFQNFVGSKSQIWLSNWVKSSKIHGFPFIGSENFTGSAEPMEPVLKTPLYIVTL